MASSEPPVKKQRSGTTATPTTLTYWNGRGLCESIRFMLAFTGEQYKEAVPGVEDATHLSEPAHMAGLRENGLLLWNQVPLLCIDGLELVQSQAIVRYLGEKHGVRGELASLIGHCTRAGVTPRCSSRSD